jgi:acetyltransferase
MMFETPVERGVKDKSESEKQIRAIIEHARKEKRLLLTEDESKTIVNHYGIETTKTLLAKTKKQAVNAARSIGYPVVMKIHSKDITHKSDCGGVVLNLGCDSEVEHAYDTMMEQIKKAVPDAAIGGVSIQQMIDPKNPEFILGSKKDPIFGSVILFGLGGIYTELFKDRAIGIPPLNQVLAHQIVRQTRAYQLLKGFRNLVAPEMKKVEETMIHFSHLIEDFPEIKEVDLNPLKATKDGLIAVDARIILDDYPKKHPHLIISKYPSHYQKTITSKDGRKILLRPIKPEDEYLWLDMFKSFSQQSVRFRFFRLIKEADHAMRVRYCNIDYDREIGIVAEIEEEGQKRFLGVTRIILPPGEQDEAEFALIVTDKWQRRGLGSEFLDFTIEIAKKKGVKRLVGEVLKDNKPMINLCKEKNFDITRTSDPEVYKLSYDIS